MSKILPAAAGFFIFLTTAVLFLSKSAYAIGPALLLLTSLLLLLPEIRRKLNTDKETQLLIVVMVLFAAVWAAGYWIDIARYTSSFDKPLRALLAIPVLLLILAVRPSFSWLVAGLWVGAVSAGGIAIFEVVIQKVGRADGPLNAIQFGNLSMLWGVFSAVVVCYLTQQKIIKSVTWFCIGLFGLATLMGILGSLFSGSRGGWVGVPFMILVFWKAYGGYFCWRIKCVFLVLITVTALAIWNTPQLGIQSRIEQAAVEFSGYIIDGRYGESSVGQRLQMWENALVMAAEKPLTGWGEWGYREYIFAAEADGRLTPDIEHQHAHNQFLDMLAKHGIPGFIAVVAFFFVPLGLFSRHLRSSDAKHKALAVAGTLLCVGFIDFGLTQAVIWHTGGMMVYSFMLVIIWAMMKNEQCRGDTGAV